MKLVFLYGPPAAGKYSIAKLLAEKTGYKLFHNHATVDLVSSVFEFGTQSFWDLVQKIRLDFFAVAAKEKLPGIIFTFVYEKNSDDSLVKRIIHTVAQNGGEILFIQIYCEKEELLKRVEEESRKQFQKVKTKEALVQMLNSGDLCSAISFVKSNRVDTTNLSIEEAAQQIIELIK